MPNVLTKYETIYIIHPAQSEEDTEALVQKFKTLVESNATLMELDPWGRRRLAYPIAKQMEGHYVRMTFESGPDFPRELDRIYNITEGVLRSLIVKMPE